MTWQLMHVFASLLRYDVARETWASKSPIPTNTPSNNIAGMRIPGRKKPNFRKNVKMSNNLFSMIFGVAARI